MLSPLVDLHIRRKSKAEHRELPENYKHILQFFSDKYSVNGTKLHYMWLWDSGGRFPNASATIPGIILVNAVWASLLVEGFEDKRIIDSFSMTIGHEMTHQEKDYFYLEPFSNEQKFVNWVNEIHADYGGIIKAFDGNVNRGIKALELKKHYKGEKDKDRRSHPSWERRIEYIKTFDFNADLIKEIAKSTNCDNKRLINKVCDYYDSIALQRRESS